MKLLDIDREAFAAGFGRAAFPLQHRLAGDSLFSLERLVALSRALPADKVEYNAGDLPISVDPATTPHRLAQAGVEHHFCSAHCRQAFVDSSAQASATR